MKYADAHCHLVDPRLDGARDAMLQRARKAGIEIFVQGGVDPEDWQRQLDLEQRGCHATFGLHPWFVAKNEEQVCRDALARLPDFLNRGVALGELGLDYLPRWHKESWPRQRHFFAAQLEMAQRHGLPLVLHVVQAHGDAVHMLQRQRHQHGGLVHGFSGSFEIAKQYLALGYTLSIGTGLLQQGFAKLKDAVARLPLDAFVVESDAPDGSVPDADWTYNEPIAVLQVAAALAAIHKTTTEHVLAQSRRRVCEIFSLE